MKDYKLLVLWIDYFNSNLSRSEGRRTPINSSLRNPTIDELTKAVKRLNYNPTPVLAFYPKRNTVQSGYINIERKKTKSIVIKEIAKALTSVRGEQTVNDSKNR